MTVNTNPFYGDTFAERLAIREAAESKPAVKQIIADEVEDKAVKSSATKAKKKP